MSDFGDIMKQWEEAQKKKGPPKGRKKEKTSEVPNPMEIWLRQNDVHDKDHHHFRTAPRGRRELLAMAPQRRIDLHGLTQEEALEEAGRFIRKAHKAGVRKVLIIHGKGHHSPGRVSVLRQKVRLFLEGNPRVGEFGAASREMGGEGATWAILKIKKGAVEGK